MERQHVRALAQDAVDHVLQNRQAVVGVQPLAVDDAHAGQAGRARISKEAPQACLGLACVHVVQVEFVLCCIVAPRQAPQEPW